MIRSLYKVSEMDCPSELNLIKLKLGAKAQNLEADFERRELWVYHSGESQEISTRLEELNLGSSWLKDEETAQISTANSKERSSLISVLILNFSFFLIEIIASFWSGSMGLAADGLDMLADALVYGLSLWALNKGLESQKSVAKSAGYFQILLALLGFAEVLRRVLGAEAAPDISTMIWISSLALIANGISLYLLRASRSEKAAMKASMIFTSNDILINLGVILSALLVHYFNAAWPDLLVGSFIFVLVLRGAKRILALAK